MDFFPEGTGESRRVITWGRNGVRLCVRDRSEWSGAETRGGAPLETHSEAEQERRGGVRRRERTVRGLGLGGWGWGLRSR